MLDTIEECDARLAELDKELERLKLLQLEWEYVSSRRKLLEDLPKAPRLSGKQRDRTLSPQLMRLIERTPGITTHELRRYIDDSYSDLDIKNRLGDLHRHKKIENRGGGRGKLGHWYIKEKDVS